MTATVASLVALDAAAWVGISVAVGAAAGFLPERALAVDSAITRVRPFEAGGRVYRRWLRIDRWKAALPEVHGVGPRRHTSKAVLPGRAALPALLRETRRAEYVHLAIAASGATFVLWNPPWLAATMFAAGLAWNAPFVAVQRATRARILALPSHRSTPRSAPRSTDLAADRRDGPPARRPAPGPARSPR